MTLMHHLMNLGVVLEKEIVKEFNRSMNKLE
jgi:hypothetical protein